MLRAESAAFFAAVLAAMYFLRPSIIFARDSAEIGRPALTLLIFARVSSEQTRPALEAPIFRRVSNEAVFPVLAFLIFIRVSRVWVLPIFAALIFSRVSADATLPVEAKLIRLRVSRVRFVRPNTPPPSLFRRFAPRNLRYIIKKISSSSHSAMGVSLRTSISGFNPRDFRSLIHAAFSTLSVLQQCSLKRCFGLFVAPTQRTSPVLGSDKR